MYLSTGIKRLVSNRFNKVMIMRSPRACKYTKYILKSTCLTVSSSAISLLTENAGRPRERHLQITVWLTKPLRL